jgi:hypothetical protein
LTPKVCNEGVSTDYAQPCLSLLCKGANLS